MPRENHRMQHTLLVVAMLTPSPFLSQATYPRLDICERMLEQAVKAFMLTFDGNTTGPHHIKPEWVVRDDRWTTIRTPQGRVVGVFRCEPHGAPSKHP